MRNIKYIPEKFYESYGSYREYVYPLIKKKHMRDFDKNFWRPSGFTANMSVLEIGCGTGLFLKFIEKRGIRNFIGIESDKKVLEYMPDDLKDKIKIIDIFDYLGGLSNGEIFDRVVLIDVLEHFNPQEGVDLLELIKPVLSRNGVVIARVPNVSSPWGTKYQYGDLTHKAAYAPGSLKQVGLMAGFDCEVLPHRRGNPRKQLFESAIEKIINLVITDPPDIWTANMVGLFRAR